MEREFVQLYRDPKDSKLKIVATNEEVVPLETFDPGILRVDPDAPIEDKRSLLDYLFRIRKSANAYEIGEGRTVTSDFDAEGHKRDYAIGIYRIYSGKVKKALDSEKIDELELGGNWF